MVAAAAVISRGARVPAFAYAAPMRLRSHVVECSLLALMSLLLSGCGPKAAKESPAPATSEKPAAGTPNGEKPVTPAKETAPSQAKTPAPTAAANPALRDPSLAAAEAPAKFRAKLETTKGDVIVEVEREWAPHGADRFYNLVKIGYFTDIALFRAVRQFVVQFGMHGDPEINRIWTTSNIPPDPVKQSNTRGYVTFAMAGSPDTRSTQLFFNLTDDNKRLDAMGFAPIGRVIEGMAVVDSFFMGYGEAPSQNDITSQGNAYLKRSFPKLDYIKSARIVE